MANKTFIIVVAWIATLLLSKLPLVIARDLLGTDIPWITPFWIASAVLLFAGSYILPLLKPLRGYFLIMGVIVALFFGIEPLISQSAVWQNLYDGRPEIVSVFGYRLLLTAGSLIVVAVMLLMGLKREEFYLTVGNLKAAAVGRMTWPVFGTIMSVLLGGLFFLFIFTQSSGVLNVSAVFTWLPLILLAAMLNAFVEEVTYRAAPLSTLLHAVGSKHAIVLTSLWFGLGHYYGGTPSGPIGLVQTGLLALLLGKAMLDTRGMGWSWIIHVVLDTVIYASIVMASL
jgi:membrane protease YdiL (CAAX protease family)